MCTYFHTPEKQAFYESEHIFPMRMYPSMDHFETKKKLLFSPFCSRHTKSRYHHQHLTHQPTKIPPRPRLPYRRLVIFIEQQKKK